MKLLELVLGSIDDKEIKKANQVLDKIKEQIPAFKELSDVDLKKSTLKFKEKINNGLTLDSILPEAFAAIYESSTRNLQQSHYDVQFLGGSIIHNGAVAEMRTGEGKTLVATLPVYLNALEGKGVHVITVNDYLARRDAVWMGQIYDGLGMSLGIINSDGQSYLYDTSHKEESLDEDRDEDGSFKVFYEYLKPCTRKEAYNADITYGTNNEYAFDYLRDNIEYEKDNIRQRGFNFALVDEVDSILIDEARNPLIIATPQKATDSFYVNFMKLANRMELGKDYEIDEKHKTIVIKESGVLKAEKAFKVENLYVEGGQKIIHYLENALRAKSLLNKDKEYVVNKGEVVIVDEFTGRLQFGRRWNSGLHQAVEAKEKLKIKEESRTFASITFQNYFRMYEKLSGMTGTGKSSEEEFRKVYGLDVISIPTHRETKRIDHPDAIFRTQKGKLIGIENLVKELNAKGQPVLIGTASIDNNEMISKHLKKVGVTHNVLNAKNHEREGEIIAEAGKKGGVTIATNLAGRGVDIKLGGTHATEDEYKKVKELGGLFVLGTERHDARRIDNQLRGRSGRQGDEGMTQFYISLDDSLMRIFGGDTIKTLIQKVDLPEEQEIENRLISKSIENSQERIEGQNFDSRKWSLEYDNVLDSHRSKAYLRRRQILFSDDVEIKKILNEYKDKSPEFKELIEKEMDEIDDFASHSFRTLLLKAIDVSWIEHLELMDYARGSVNLRSYGQKEPITEYKREGVQLFNEFWERVDLIVFNNIKNLSKEKTNV